MYDWNKVQENMKQATEDGLRPPVYKPAVTEKVHTTPSWTTVLKVNNHGTFVPKSKFEQKTEVDKTGVWLDAQVDVNGEEGNYTIYLQRYEAKAFLDRIEKETLDLSRPFGLALLKAGYNDRKTNGAWFAQEKAE